MSNFLRAGLPIGAPRKRKDREEPSTSKLEPAQEKPASTLAEGSRLLAGYMAHEFLTKGTLLGKKWEPVRSDRPNPVQSFAKPGSSETGKAYAEISALIMKPNGAHIPGVVNPAQLARWLQM